MQLFSITLALDLFHVVAFRDASYQKLLWEYIFINQEQNIVI